MPMYDHVRSACAERFIRNVLTRFARTACGTLRAPQLGASEVDAHLRSSLADPFGIRNDCRGAYKASSAGVSRGLFERLSISVIISIQTHKMCASRSDAHLRSSRFLGCQMCACALHAHSEAFGIIQSQRVDRKQKLAAKLPISKIAL